MATANWKGAGFDLEVSGDDEELADNVIDTGETEVVSTLPVRMMIVGLGAVVAFALWRRWS